MANEAFALSPISARAAQPSEADYDAIQEAFMETSRGRWFLGEYAKRNRNADTKMVLDAVARIEETLAATKQPPEPEPTRDPLLDALASFRVALTQARAAATTAVGDLALEQNLAPVRKGARVIREIAWRLREIGADGRICDLIDSQVDAIQGAAGKLNSADLAAALHGAFDQVEGQLAGFDAEEAMASPPQAAPWQTAEAAPAAAATAEAAAQAEVVVEEPAATGQAMQLSDIVHEVPAEAETEAMTETMAPAVSAEPAVTVASEAVSEPADAFDANDEALLDMVALEMGAPDTDAAYEPKLEELQASEPQTFEIAVEEPNAQAPQAAETSENSASYEIDVTFPESNDRAEESVMATALPEVTPLQPVPKPEPTFVPAPEPSLGSSLLANGIVPRPRTRPDPLAPIRRMTQTEKIAFFS
jgi:hypothetical protein